MFLYFFFHLTLITWMMVHYNCHLQVCLYTWKVAMVTSDLYRNRYFVLLLHIWKSTIINYRKPLDLPPITAFLMLPWQHIGFHGNRYLSFLLPSIMDLPGTYFPNQWNIWEFRTFFHHHSNRYQGNQILLFFPLLGSHGPCSCQLSSRSVQNWGKNSVTPVMFRTPAQYIYDDDGKIPKV